MAISLTAAKMAEEVPLGVRWARVIGVFAVLGTLAVLLYGLATGALIVSMDWDALNCMDPDTHPCDETQADSGLSTIRASSWGLAAAALTAVLAAGTLAVRMRRKAWLAAVAAMCAFALVVIDVLYDRV